MIHKFITTILFLSFSYSAFATEKPYPFWLAEKDNKKVYMLGTVHTTGLDAYQCPSEIKNRIENSDLVFTESGSLTNHLLSMEDRRALMIGSESEKEAVLDNLPEEDRIKVSKAFTNRYDWFTPHFRLNYLNIKYESWGDATFEELSPQTQDFLINHGFKPSTYNKEDFLKEAFYFIYRTAFYDDFFDTDLMDVEVSLFTKSNKIPIKALDNEKSLYPEKDFQDLMSKKTTQLVQINSIEEYVGAYDQLKEGFSLNNTKSLEKDLSDISQALLKEQEQKTEGIGTDNLFKNVVSYIQDQTEVVLSAVSQTLYQNNLEDSLLLNRNIIWVEKINQALNTEENNSIFVAGGAFHFLGTDSVRDMLKEEGFNIKKLHCSEESLIQD